MCVDCACNTQNSLLFMYEFFVCEYCIFLHRKHVMSCRGYVYPVVKLVQKVLCLFTLHICRFYQDARSAKHQNLVQFWICYIYMAFSQFPSLPWLFFPSSPPTWRSRDMCDVWPYLLGTLSALRGHRGGVET